MLVGGRCSGWSRAWRHTVAYARAYAFIGLLTALFGPVVILTYAILIVGVPGAFCANLLFVRLFPKVSWIREPRRAWIAAAAGVPLAVIGSLTWLSVGAGPPEVIERLGFWGTACYIVGIPLLFSNLGVLIGYRERRRVTMLAGMLFRRQPVA